MINSAAMLLDVFKKMDDFVKKQEAQTAGCYQKNGNHFVKYSDYWFALIFLTGLCRKVFVRQCLPFAGMPRQDCSGPVDV
ncbi:hypothetical protein [Dyadobacter flavalbus]|uniref:hypothetical protein n=1 Tax=Dyadobacter flavalbus TaxID=2579942 RepID=UPI001375DDF6|nr:hypothetical protein [Dyadobacter flavalbus]